MEQIRITVCHLIYFYFKSHSFVLTDGSVCTVIESAIVFSINAIVTEDRRDNKEREDFFVYHSNWINSAWKQVHPTNWPQYSTRVNHTMTKHAFECIGSEFGFSLCLKLTDHFNKFWKKMSNTTSVCQICALTNEIHTKFDIELMLFLLLVLLLSFGYLP